MESNINLESLREISESQLEALLRYDSPPETPIEPIGRTVSSGYSNKEHLHESKYDDDISVNCNILHNREQLLSHADSQIDFSVFHHYSQNNQWSISPFNMQSNVNDNTIIVTSLLDTVEIPDDRDKNISHTKDESFIELDKTDPNFCNLIEKKVERDSVNETKCSNNEENNFDEVDKIFKKIECMSNLDISNIYKWDGSNCIQRQCQTQLELTPSLKKNEKKTFSCPVQTDFGNKHSNLLYTKTLRFSPENKFDSIKLQSTNLSHFNQREYENISNMDTNLCFSSDKKLNDDTIEVAGAFEKPSCEDIFNCPSTIQVQTQRNTGYFFDDNVSKDNIHIYSKNSSNINMLLDDSSIPLSVKQLYDIVKTNYSDFAFIYALSSQLCQDRVPMECFVTLKIALLLSLASIGNNEYRAPIPIVAMADDTHMTDYLMTNIGQLGSRFLGPVDEMKSFSNSNWIEADSILLARGGVYYAGDWGRLKLIRSENIFKNIECSRVAIEKSTLSFPLETAIWTHWRSFKYGAKDQQRFNTFLKIFGIPIFVSDDNHEALIDYTLEQSSIRMFESTVDHLSVNADDMRNFLVYISQNNVDLSPEAAFLLKNYFVATRSTRQDCLSKQSYIMLKQFAESFAKLSMRKVVSSDDALAAIILCEHFIENTFSSSDNSPPHFGNFTFVGTVDEYLIQFREWLDSYIENFKNA